MVSIRLQQLFKLPSVALMAAWIDQAPAHSEDQWRQHDLPAGFVELNKGDGRAPFFLIHPIGGTVFCYVKLASALTPDQSVYAIETVVERQAGALSLESMAEYYLQRIQKVQPFGPYRLGGWSFGGLVAWEIARQMRQQGEKVTLLALIDTYPPTGGDRNFDPEALRRRATALLYEELVRNVINEHAESDPEVGGSVNGEPRLSDVEELLVQKGLAASGNKQQETLRLLAAYEQNLFAMETYSVRPAAQPVILFAASESVYADHLHSEWSKYTQQSVECIVVPCSHYTMMKSACVERIAKRIDSAIMERID